LLVCFTLAQATRDYRSEFQLWTAQYGKTYSLFDLTFRFNVWKKNMDLIDAHNNNPHPASSMKLAMNSFGDLTLAEFQRYQLGLRPNLTVVGGETIFPQPGAPDTMDWRTKGAVTPIKNQGQCGSCWSFSTTGSVEGCHQIKNKKLVSLSEQNLVDCSKPQGNEGCNGGLMTAAMDYIIKNKGIDTESSYPYTARDGTTCKYQAANSGATLTGYGNIQSGNENALQAAGVTGPVSVAIDASHNSFQFYSSGVYYEAACSPSQLDHGVLMVGWGTDGGADYWLVKNSWGTDWGMKGYIEMARNRDNNCGIATMATLPKC